MILMRVVSVGFLLFFALAFSAPQASWAAPSKWPKVEIYTTSWCPYCKKATAYLRSKGIPFTEYDVEKDKRAASDFRKLNPRGAVPLAVIGGDVILGFSLPDYEEALGLK